ncbi:hypothetical protein LT330_010776 [Penicillium expansum]|nr:hypothetical protein LT330_010776 [Penicillium expansum]
MSSVTIAISHLSFTTTAISQLSFTTTAISHLSLTTGAISHLSLTTSTTAFDRSSINCLTFSTSRLAYTSVPGCLTQSPSLPLISHLRLLQRENIRRLYP